MSVITKKVSADAGVDAGSAITQTIIMQPEKVNKADMAADSQPLPAWNTILLLAAVTAVAVWALVQIVKSFCQGWMDSGKDEDGKKPWWWTGGLRLLALCAGAGLGAVLYGALGGIGSGWPWGAAIGAGAGSLASIVVMVVKKRIRAMAPSESE